MGRSGDAARELRCRKKWNECVRAYEVYISFDQDMNRTAEVLGVCLSTARKRVYYYHNATKHSDNDRECEEQSSPEIRVGVKSRGDTSDDDKYVSEDIRRMYRELGLGT
jgi:hypothetical protein